jgi:pimeloyl-ACP methyl ester carboxylesterase
MGRVLLIYCALVISLPAAVFQYAVPIKTLNGDRTVYLWVPPDAERIRGVLVAGTTLAERMCVQDPVVRQACTDEKLAIIYYKTGLSTLDAQDVLDALAKTSGYRELSIAPLFFMGHSAGGPKAKAQALAFADRCFGLMLYRGGVPGGDKPLPPGIPCLMMVGQFDEFGGVMRDEDGREGPWDRPFEAIMEYRRGDSANLASIVVEPGAGHFGWSARNAEYFALFLRKAAQARIPEWAMHGHAPVVCKPIDPQTGWLATGFGCGLQGRSPKSDLVL